MRRPVVAPQHHVVVEVQQIEFRKRPARSKRVHDLHCLNVLHLAFAGHGHVSGRQQGISGMMLVTMSSNSLPLVLS